MDDDNDDDDDDDDGSNAPGACEMCVKTPCVNGCAVSFRDTTSWAKCYMSSVFATGFSHTQKLCVP